MIGQLLRNSIMSKSIQSYSSQKENLRWLDHLKEDTAVFLNNMGNEDFSHFGYSYSGDLFYPPEDHWGLANTVFAVKILYITRLLPDIPLYKKENLYRKIVAFEHREGIYDPLITKLSSTDKLKKLVGRLDRKKIDYYQEITRAETRQSFAALYLLNKQPAKPYLLIPYSKKGIDKYLSELNWKTPWAAGSHFSHLLFFLKMNALLFDYETNLSQTLINYAVDWISGLQSKEDGSWYQGDDVSLTQKINGAMKILTGFHAAHIYEFSHAKRLIDMALLGINDAEACSNFNIVYVLYACHKLFPDYRSDEITSFLINRVGLYKTFFHEHLKGFSFHRNKANEFFYGKRISKGKNEPDIHGTIMFIWGLCLIDEILDLRLGFRVPVN